MKKIIAATLIVITSFCANAQNFGVGIKAGTNLTKISGKQFKDEFNFGYYAGVFAEFELSKTWGLQPEILYNQVNTKTTSNFDSAIGTWPKDISSIKLNYLTIPILLRCNINKFVSLHAGPQFGLLLNKDESAWQTVSATGTNTRTAIKSGDLSVIGGITVNVTSLRIFGRYVVGLNNISDVPNSDSWKSQQIQLGIGYSF